MINEKMVKIEKKRNITLHELEELIKDKNIKVQIYAENITKNGKRGMNGMNIHVINSLQLTHDECEIINKDVDDDTRLLGVMLSDQKFGCTLSQKKIKELDITVSEYFVKQLYDHGFPIKRYNRDNPWVKGRNKAIKRFGFTKYLEKRKLKVVNVKVGI